MSDVYIDSCVYLSQTPPLSFLLGMSLSSHSSQSNGEEDGIDHSERERGRQRERDDVYKYSEIFIYGGYTSWGLFSTFLS